jgi:hypothetical protein
MVAHLWLGGIFNFVFLLSMLLTHLSIQDWTFDVSGLMRKRMMSGNDLPISNNDRWFKPGVDIESVEITEEHL